MTYYSSDSGVSPISEIAGVIFCCH